MSSQKWPVWVGVFAVVALVYLGYKAYVSIPDPVISRAQSVESGLKRQSGRLGRATSYLAQTKSSDDWNFLAPYAKAEAWEQSLKSSESDLAKANAIYKDDITPIVERDHKDGVPALVKHIERAQALIDSSIESAQHPEQRMKLILNGRKNKEQYLEKSQTLAANSKPTTDNFTEQANKLADAYPDKREDLLTKVAGAQEALAKVTASATTIKQEYNASGTNYAVYADTFASLKTQHEQLLAYINSNQALINQLERSYVKILKDQMVNYGVIIGRANWCNSDGCGSGTQMRYPPASVDEDTFEYFDTLTLDTIASYGSSWGRSSFNLQIPAARWDALGLDPTYRWSSRLNTAEYWVDSLKADTYHQYTIIENGEMTETKWQEVPNAMFWGHYNDLGMAIATKPKGLYESETKETAEPVGMAMIAEPTVNNGVASGSNQYGEWRQSNGTSIWFYYGMYRLLGDFTGSRGYRYNDWNDYRRHDRSKPYYGRNGGYGTYGSQTYANPRYQNSNFAQRNPQVKTQATTGRSTQGANSIRGAGASTRARGPSGGGK